MNQTKWISFLLGEIYVSFERDKVNREWEKLYKLGKWIKMKTVGRVGLVTRYFASVVVPFFNPSRTRKKENITHRCFVITRH